MTQSEYNQFLARQRQPIDSMAPTGSKDAPESDLHDAILNDCRRRGWIAFHGSMAHSTFRTLGEPDFVILGDGGRVFLIEAKSINGKLSPEQAAINAWASKLGHKVHVVRSLQDFLEIV